jgi:hypothetical protein
MVSDWIAESITWLLSVMSTDLVRLPWVASISLFSSRASSRSRFMGAALGEIMATTLLETTEFPKPILTSFGLIDKAPFVLGLELSAVSIQQNQHKEPTLTAS